MAFLQKDHLLSIDTILNDDANEKKFQSDPLLLVKLDGVDAISRLYAYDVIMLRDAGDEEVSGQKRQPIDTTKLIGTHAVIGARPSKATTQTDDTIPFKRSGMFETFEDLLNVDITKIPIIAERDFHIYRGRVVPWVKVLSRDICYRIFEKKTVVDIIEAIAEEAKKTFPHLLIDTKALHNSQHPFTPIDYCVQFGESTLDFLSRLMARFGIWYFFGHSPSQASFLLNETMFLRGPFDRSFPDIGFTDVDLAESDPGFKQIAKLVRRFRPPERRVAIGGFNYLDPSNPFYKDGTVDPKDDLLKNEGGLASQTKFSGSTSFAQPVFSQDDADALSKAANSQNESEVFLLSCISKNQTMIAGHKFHINKAKDFDEKKFKDTPFTDVVDKKFIIDAMAITVNDYTYIDFHVPVIPFSDEFLNGLFNAASSLQADATDDTNNALYKVSLWATAAAQAKIYTAVNPLAGNFADTGSGTDVDIAAAANMLAGAAAGVIPVPVVGGILSGADFKKAMIAAKNIAAFAVGVIAVPADPPVDPPLPLYTRPVARGPHTALVIGPDDGKGVELHGQDIFCDALGRVRVRFPWDPGPPQGGSKIPPVFPYSDPSKPTKVGGNTCWVRVSEGWAGRHYGIQFLPRIGQEVIVDFLDGDPERPVITGRLYNADRRTTNLPFPAESQEKTELLDLSKVPNTATTDPPLSGIKTFSIPTTDGDGKPLPVRFHLLRFSDKRDKEQYLIRSQRRLDITALQKRYESISSDRHLTVGGKKITPPPKEIGGDYIAKVFRHYHLHVGDPEFPTQSGNRNTLLEQNENLQVKGSLNQFVGGNWSVTLGGGLVPAGGQATIDVPGVGGMIVLNAMANITLNCGASSIVITPAAISITSAAISLNGLVLGPPPVPTPTPLPPMPPIDAGPVTPQEPTPADPGDKLTPPQE